MTSPPPSSNPLQSSFTSKPFIPAPKTLRSPALRRLGNWVLPSFATAKSGAAAGSGVVDSDGNKLSIPSASPPAIVTLSTSSSPESSVTTSPYSSSASLSHPAILRSTLRESSAQPGVLKEAARYFSTGVEKKEMASAGGNGRGDLSLRTTSLGVEQTGSRGGSSRGSRATTPVSQEHAMLPPFLRQSKSEIHNKFIDLEWQQRERLHAGITSDATSDNPSQWARLKGEEINRRNRYFNVDPYMGNRVRLRGVAEGESDYINASPIKLARTRSSGGGVDSSLEFIATQGPKDTSTSHFWKMIWDETGDPAIIVMLTQTEESGREKCFQYFPLDEDNSHILVEDEPLEESLQEGETPSEPKATPFRAEVVLKSIRQDAASHSVVREIEIRSAETQTTKRVFHLLFSGWPDFLVPEGEDREALVNLVRLSSSLASSASPSNGHYGMNPRIIHCSAGVGRTGSFIALDYLLEELEAGAYDQMSQEVQGDDMEDPIVDLVDVLRQQRMMMVQGEQQFWFLYDMLRERWLERYRARHSGTSG